MEAGPDANSKAEEIEAEISETRELIQKLTEEENLMLNQVKIVENQLSRTNTQLRLIEHLKVEGWIKAVMEEIDQLEKFPHMLRPPSQQQEQQQVCTWKEQIRTLTTKMYHGKMNLVAERKNLNEIQQLEKKRVQSDIDKLDDDDGDGFNPSRPTPNFGRLVRVKYGSKDFHTAVLEEWVEKIKHVSELMILDRRNAVANLESCEALGQLSNLRSKLYYMINEDNREKFQHSWEIMPDVKNIIQHLRGRLGKVKKQSSREGYAESVQLEQKKTADTRVLWRIESKLWYDVQRPKEKAWRKLKRLEDSKLTITGMTV